MTLGVRFPTQTLSPDTSLPSVFGSHLSLSEVTRFEYGTTHYTLNKYYPELTCISHGTLSFWGGLLQILETRNKNSKYRSVKDGVQETWSVTGRLEESPENYLVRQVSGTRRVYYKEDGPSGQRKV